MWYKLFSPQEENGKEIRIIANLTSCEAYYQEMLV